MIVLILFSWIWCWWKFVLVDAADKTCKDPTKSGALFSDKQIVVTTKAIGAVSVVVGDLNGDGWLDLASASYHDNKIAWYKNTDGKGTFGPQIIVTTNAIGANCVAVGDLNGDGWLDLASASQGGGQSGQLKPKIAWYENIDGKGTFGQQIVVTTKAKFAASIVVGDLNGDGWLDLASASQNDDKIAWYQNDGPCCPPGQGSNDNVHCTSCMPGHFGLNISTPCLSCPSGWITKITGATHCTKLPEPICCQARAADPTYKELCLKIRNETACLKNFGLVCDWTCGECDAKKGLEQYEKWCNQHNNFNSCGLVNATCEWVPIPAN